MVNVERNQFERFITHGILSGDAHERVENSQLEKLIITNSIPAKKDPKIKVLSCAELFSSSEIYL